jgi:hypothetical protein
MSRLPPPPPIENKLQILVSLYKKKSGVCRSLFLFAVLVTLSLMGYIVVDSYGLMESTSAGGGSNIVTVTIKKMPTFTNKSHQTLSLIEFRIEDPNVAKFLESLPPIDADDWGKQNVNYKNKEEKMKAIAARQKIKAARASNSNISHETLEDPVPVPVPVPVHRDDGNDNDNVREHSSFTSAAEFDDACTRLPRLRVTVKTQYNKSFSRPGWPTHHFHSSFQLHAIIYWAMVSQNLEEVCLYLPRGHSRQYREYLNVLLPTFRFVLHPNRKLFNDSLTAVEMQPMSSTLAWEEWIRDHPNGEPYRKFSSTSKLRTTSTSAVTQTPRWYF